MTDKIVNDFIKNKNHWREDNVLALIAERGKCLEILKRINTESFEHVDWNTSAMMKNLQKK